MKRKASILVVDDEIEVVRALQRKIEPDPAHPRFLITISGVGYRFNDDWLRIKEDGEKS